jgi:hypothetical protein
MTSKSGKPKDPSGGQLFVYGLDEAGKPKGARFPATEAERVRPVATAMNLHWSQAGSEETAGPGMKLPVGRIYARGKAFIPNIKRDLYEKLVAALNSARDKSDRSQGDGSAASSTVSKGEAAQSPADTGTILPPLASGLPQNWESIAAGNMVLIDAGPGEGWWEAIVINRDDAILTLRYRDFPKLPKFERHVSTVALINPRPA